MRRTLCVLCLLRAAADCEAPARSAVMLQTEALEAKMAPRKDANVSLGVAESHAKAKGQAIPVEAKAKAGAFWEEIFIAASIVILLAILAVVAYAWPPPR
ncbi:unnamed protein product [Effrenium voratum]|uniref:Uncharacterized protein n=1 Tax=Effrenium voratum TaxID=2562239 RepID=A0AA36HRX3_9DINO|nr:unnamed protein product [Effrenium voratum]